LKLANQVVADFLFDRTYRAPLPLQVAERVDRFRHEAILSSYTEDP
jgi:hypothetical protein